MHVEPLPNEVKRLCQTVNAPERLTRHLILVHHIANRLLEAVGVEFPDLRIDNAAVSFGAATHDLGKVLHPDELTGPGRLHEQDGPPLLERHGVAPRLARFARTHGTWQSEPVELEDLLVALADKIWKGKRDDALESELTRRIATSIDADQWWVFEMLDGLLTDLADEADERLAWQSASGQ